MRRILPIRRANDLARTGWPLVGQAFALRSFVPGFLVATADPHPRSGVDAPERVLAPAVTALLGPGRAARERVRATAEQGPRTLACERATVPDLVGGPSGSD